MADSEDWIPARNSVSLLSPVYGGTDAAKAVLLDQLRDGAIAARATEVAEYKMARGARPGTLKPWPEQSSQSQFVLPGDSPYLLIDPVVWAESSDWKGDTARWDWGSGTFEVVIEFRVPPGTMFIPGGSLVFVAYGAEFRRTDIAALAGNSKFRPSSFPQNPGASASEDPPAMLGKRRGRKRKSEWDLWIGELVLESHQHPFPLNMTPDELIDAVNARVGVTEELARNTAYSAASKVLERWMHFQQCQQSRTEDC